MKIEFENSGGVTIVRLQGRLTIGSSCLIARDAVMEQIEDGCKMMVLDLKGISFMDSSGVTELATYYIESRRWGCRIMLAGLTAQCGKLLEVTGLSGIFECFESPYEAAKTLLERKIA